MRAEAALAQTAGAAGAPTLERRERPLWQVALAAWLSQRLLIGALTLLWQFLLREFSPAAFYAVWKLYDGVYYTQIARGGYHLLPEAAYFPLYPLLMRVTAPLVGGHISLAGILLANGFSLAAFILLARLVAAEFGASTARRTLLYYALFPTGFFFAAVYTEALFLLLSVAAFLAMRQRRWLLAGALIALATLTRAPGALLLLPLAFEAWRALRPAGAMAWAKLGFGRRLRVGLALLAACALPLLAFVGMQLYLSHLYGIPDVLSRAADDPQWLRYLDWPWAGAVNDVATLTQHGVFVPVLEIIKDFVFLAFWLGLCILMLLPARWRQWANLPHSWILYSWATLLQFLVLPAHIRGGGLMSAPRYVLVVFPCLVLTALISQRHPNANRLMFALCIIWTIILTRLLADGTFVA